MIEPGSQFGAYRIQDKLGEGGMGVVYRAVDTELQRTVAIKTLLGSPDSDAIARFLREAKAASRLQHPTVVTIYHVGVQADTRYIVMEFVEGSTLKKVIGGRPMNLRQACDVAIQILEGLAAAHEMGVVHRDIKAENIIISPRGGVKILDFGLAKLAEVATPDGATVVRTEAGVVMGTVSHMSPEQAMGQEVDHRTDIFSFGAMFYEMLTGRSPFAAQTAQAILARVLNHEPESVSLSNPAVTPELEQTARDCLQKDRALRPTAPEVLTMLRSAREGLSGFTPGAAVGVVPPAGAVLTPGSGRMQSGRGSGQVRLSQRGTATAVSSGQTAVQTAIDVDAGQAGPTLEMRASYWGLRTLRLAITVLTATVPLAFLLHFLLGGGVIRPELLEGTFVMSYVTAIVAPVQNLADTVLTFRTVVGPWNLLLPAMAIFAFVLRRVAHLPFERAEQWAKQRVVKATRIETKGPSMAAGGRVTDQRMAMLREYAETKKLLFQQKRRLAFLSVDVVNAARVKSGEDKLVIEHAFAEYRKYVERVLASNNVWKTTWQAETALCAFFTVDAAVRAGQQIIRELSWFNDGVHQARVKFEAHCGVSMGDVVFPDDKRIEDLTDETLDLAVSLRESAPTGALWMSRESQAEVADATGFTNANVRVSGQEVREWRHVPERAPRVTPVSPAPAVPAMAAPEPTMDFGQTQAPKRPVDLGEATIPPPSRTAIESVGEATIGPPARPVSDDLGEPTIGPPSRTEREDLGATIPPKRH